MGVCIPHSKCHTRGWDSVSPTGGATPKRGSLYPTLEGPHHSVGVLIPNSRAHGAPARWGPVFFFRVSEGAGDQTGGCNGIRIQTEQEPKSASNDAPVAVHTEPHEASEQCSCYDLSFEGMRGPVESLE